MAGNSVNYRSQFGMLKDLYVGVTGGKGTLVVQEEMPVASLLTLTTQGVVVTPDPDKSWLTARTEFFMNLYSAYSNNNVKASNRMGSYPQPDEANP